MTMTSNKGGLKFLDNTYDNKKIETQTKKPTKTFQIYQDNHIKLNSLQNIIEHQELKSISIQTDVIKTTSSEIQTEETKSFQKTSYDVQKIIEKLQNEVKELKDNLDEKNSEILKLKEWLDIGDSQEAKQLICALEEATTEHFDDVKLQQENALSDALKENEMLYKKITILEADKTEALKSVKKLENELKQEKIYSEDIEKQADKFSNYIEEHINAEKNKL